MHYKIESSCGITSIIDYSSPKTLKNLTTLEIGLHVEKPVFTYNGNEISILKTQEIAKNIFSYFEKQYRKPLNILRRTWDWVLDFIGVGGQYSKIKEVYTKIQQHKIPTEISTPLSSSRRKENDEYHWERQTCASPKKEKSFKPIYNPSLNSKVESPSAHISRSSVPPTSCSPFSAEYAEQDRRLDQLGFEVKHLKASAESLQQGQQLGSCSEFVPRSTAHPSQYTIPPESALDRAAKEVEKTTNEVKNFFGNLFGGSKPAAAASQQKALPKTSSQKRETRAGGLDRLQQRTGSLESSSVNFYQVCKELRQKAQRDAGMEVDD